MRQVIVIFVAAVLIGYDLFKFNGYYLKLAYAKAMAAWHAIEVFVLGLF